jgi:hypothetical protein
MPWFLDSTLPSKSSNVQQKTYQQDSAGFSRMLKRHNLTQDEDSTDLTARRTGE